MIDSDHNQQQEQGDSVAPSLEKARSLAERITGASEYMGQAEMPRYQCHKIVHALKIKEVIDPTEPGNESDGSRIIIPADKGYGQFAVSNNYVGKHKPEAGGYYVVYDDGYKSFSPAKAFEDGYTHI